MTERKFTPFEDNGIQEYVTRDGREAKVCVENSSTHPHIKGFIRQSQSRQWAPYTWFTDGSVSAKEEEADLFDVPVKHTRWVNIYYPAAEGYSSKKEANMSASSSRVACIQVTFEEGEGL
jgi:hypothetical protein